jgi:hypothetical protein
LEVGGLEGMLKVPSVRKPFHVWNNAETRTTHNAHTTQTRDKAHGQTHDHADCRHYIILSSVRRPIRTTTTTTTTK